MIDGVLESRIFSSVNWKLTGREGEFYTFFSIQGLGRRLEPEKNLNPIKSFYMGAIAR
jgi:hypothetical protein